MKWTATCEHTSGASTGHPCTTGIYDDPADSWEINLDATTHAEAEQSAQDQLRHDVAHWRPCDCRRRAQPGNERWWASIVVHVAPAALSPAERAVYLAADDEARLSVVTTWRATHTSA
jgi:hypothetical protein